MNYGYSDPGFGRYFLENEHSEPVTSRKNNWRYWLPIIKSELSSEIRILDSIPILNNFFNDVSSDVKKCDFFFDTAELHVSTFGRSADLGKPLLFK